MNNANNNTKIKTFCFNPFQENTYIIIHPNNDCWIIDPGCYTKQECDILNNYIAENKLKPTKLLNTHCHLDHIYGNKMVAEKYNIDLYIHEKELPVLDAAARVASMYGAKIPEKCEPKYFLAEGEKIFLNEIEFDIIFTPGHSPGSICFVNHTEHYAIVGDVLFNGSIGRTDLPGGDYDTLIKSIKSKLYTLADNYVIYNGHGIETTIGNEKKNNPFVKG